MKRAWLELYDWEFVTATNAALCQPKKALHKLTRDGHDRARRLWEENHRREMSLAEAAELSAPAGRTGTRAELVGAEGFEPPTYSV